MTASDTAVRLRSIVAEYCEGSPGITGASTWDSLGLDSLDQIEIELEVEAAFHIPAERFTNPRGDLPPSFGELVATIERLRGSTSP